MVFGIIVISIHAPIANYLGGLFGDYSYREYIRTYHGRVAYEFYGVTIVLWIIFLIMQSVSALLFTSATWVIIKLRAYMKQRKAIC